MTGPADPDRRFLAFVIDRSIGWGVDLAVTLTVARHLVVRGHPTAGVLVVAATVLLVGTAFALVTGTTGRTPGKRLLGLRLVHTGSGEPLGVGRALLRTFVVGASAVPFGCGLAALAGTAVADPARLRRGWHDQLVASIVLDTRRPVLSPEPVPAPGPRDAVNLTALRLAPVDSTLAMVPTSAPTVPVLPTLPTESEPREARWTLVFDTGVRVAVDTLVLVGERPEPGRGERGARLVALPTTDRSLSATHLQVVVAPDGALVVTDRASAHGSTLVRQGLARRLAAARPATLLAGDVVLLGDRTMTVEIA